MQKNINLVLFKPAHPRFNILDSHLEVIESLRWGFEALGMDCSVRTNQIDLGRINIVFGWIPAIQMGLINEFPDDSILYNFEQYSTESMLGTGLDEVAQRFQIWDYSAGNVLRWNEINPRFPAYYAKVSYSPTLSRLDPPPAQGEDIDVLYVGGLGPNRSRKIAAIATTLSRNSVVSLTNVWGQQRDDFMARAKLLINVSEENPRLKIFEIVRVSYYLANRKAVVCEYVPDLEIEEDLRSVLRFAHSPDLGSACDQFIQDPRERQNYADNCFEAFRKRDVRDMIKGFFS